VLLSAELLSAELLSAELLSAELLSAELLSAELLVDLCPCLHLQHTLHCRQRCIIYAYAAHSRRHVSNRQAQSAMLLCALLWYNPIEGTKVSILLACIPAIIAAAFRLGVLHTFQVRPATNQ
jgi:hypothetical protein